MFICPCCFIFQEEKSITKIVTSTVEVATKARKRKLNDNDLKTSVSAVTSVTTPTSNNISTSTVSAPASKPLKNQSQAKRNGIKFQLMFHLQQKGRRETFQAQDKEQQAVKVRIFLLVS